VQIVSIIKANNFVMLMFNFSHLPVCNRQAKSKLLKIKHFASNIIRNKSFSLYYKIWFYHHFSGLIKYRKRFITNDIIQNTAISIPYREYINYCFFYNNLTSTRFPLNKQQYLKTSITMLFTF